MFGEFLTENSYEIEFERLGIRTAINPLSEDELEECRRMKGMAGACYALYLACPALHEEGERLYKEGVIFSPLDITQAVDAADVNAAYKYIREISGMGESRVNLYKNDRPAFGADEIFDEMSRNEGYSDENGRSAEYYGESGRYQSETDGKGHFVTRNGESRHIVAENDENRQDMEKIAEILAYKLRMAAENM